MQHTKRIAALMFLIPIMIITGCGPGPAAVDPTAQVETAVAVVQTLTAEAQPPPTATPSPSPAPTATLTPTPSPTSTPSPTPTPTPTPQPEVDLAQVIARLEDQTSYQFDMILEGDESTVHLEGVHVVEPDSWRFNEVAAGGMSDLTQYVAIGDRLWVMWTVQTMLSPIECQSDGSLDFLCTLPALYMNMLKVFLNVELEDSVAPYVSGPTTIEGIPAYEYVLTEETGATTRWFLAADTYLPVRAELFEEGGSPHQVWTFSHFNDPGNLVENPNFADTYPASLHSDDAWMALNGLSSFHWTFTMRTEGSEGTNVLLRFEGDYVARERSFVSSLWPPSALSDEGEAAGDPDYSYLRIGDDVWGKSQTDEVWGDPSFLGLEGLFEPFVAWERLAPGKGALVGEGSRTIEGVLCNEYHYTVEGTNQEGTAASQEATLFAREDGLPMRMESTLHVYGADPFSRYETWQISHINDAEIAIEPPEMEEEAAVEPTAVEPVEPEEETE
jgi:hypothetical protein